MAERTSDEADDLPSPLELCQRLETVELNDDETESLLQEALALNKRLKEELQKRENEEDADNGEQNNGIGSAHVGKQTSKMRRPGQKSNPLPPIAPKKGQSPGTGGHRKGAPARSRVQQERRGASSPAPYATIGRIVNSAGSVEGSQRRTKSATEKEGRVTRSAEQRKKKPVWNDRFSYE